MSASDYRPPGVDVVALQAEQHELEQRLATVKRILSAVGFKPETNQGRRSRKNRRKNTRIHQIAEVLREAGRPLPIEDIYGALRKREPSLRWKSPANILRAYLQRQERGPDEVVRAGRGVYGLRQWAEKSQLHAIASIPEANGTKLDVLCRILHEEGSPLPVSEIYTRMRAVYPDLKWKHPAETIYAMWRRSPTRLDRFGSGVWGLPEWREGGKQDTAN